MLCHMLSRGQRKHQWSGNDLRNPPGFGLTNEGVDLMWIDSFESQTELMKVSYVSQDAT